MTVSDDIRGYHVTVVVNIYNIKYNTVNLLKAEFVFSEPSRLILVKNGNYCDF
jgi:hypothetical protein